MNDEFELLREALSSGRPLSAEVPVAEACNRRLLRAVGHGGGYRPGEARRKRLVVLVRDYLLEWNRLETFSGQN